MACTIPNFINLKHIDYRPRKIFANRYYLYFKIKRKKRKKIVFIIMKNPSESFKGYHLKKTKNYTDKFLDITTTKAITLAKKKGYTDIFLLNLYPYYDSVARNINSHYGFVKRSNPKSNPVANDAVRYLKNIEVIEKLYNKYKELKPDVILACGNANGIFRGYYDARIKEILNFACKNSIVLKEVARYKSKCKGISSGKICYPKHPQRWGYNDNIY